MLAQHALSVQDEGDADVVAFHGAHERLGHAVAFRALDRRRPGGQVGAVVTDRQTLIGVVENRVRLRAEVLPAQRPPLNATDPHQPCASMLGRLLRRCGSGIPARRERRPQHHLGRGEIACEDDKQ
jgi:hypothetical protein